jgi:hypothetical protein
MKGKAARTTHNIAFWIAVIASVNVVHLWLFFDLGSGRPVQFWFTIAVQLLAIVGGFWMLAHWFVKRRKKLCWQRWMWLFFVPWGFLWYVFEKWEPAVSDFDRFSRRGT